MAVTSIPVMLVASSAFVAVAEPIEEPVVSLLPVHGPVVVV